MVTLPLAVNFAVSSGKISYLFLKVANFITNTVDTEDASDTRGHGIETSHWQLFWTVTYWLPVGKKKNRPGNIDKDTYGITQLVAVFCLTVHNIDIIWINWQIEYQKDGNSGGTLNIERVTYKKQSSIMDGHVICFPSLHETNNQTMTISNQERESRSGTVVNDIKPFLRGVNLEKSRFSPFSL